MEGVFRKIEAQTGIQIDIQAARLFDQIDALGDTRFARGEEFGRLFGDEIVFISGEDRLVESHPAKGCTGLDDLVKIALFIFTQHDGFFRAQIVAEDFHEQLPAIENVVNTIIRTYRDGKTVYAFGNGGSAADANHFITELVGRFLIERKGLPALSFSTNEILMTSIANDYGYENTFSRQVEAFVKERDLVVAFSTSGKSRNVIKALDLARSKGATTVGFTGNSAGDFPGLCDVCIRVPSESAPRIQESHLAVVHIICELLERELTVAQSALSERQRQGYSS